MGILQRLGFAQKDHDPPPTQPATEEGYSYPSIAFDIEFRHFNPDTLVWLKGPEIYKKMRQDAQVKASYDFKLNAIISRPWSFQIDADDPQQEEIKEFLIQNITQDFKGTFQMGLRAVLDSMRVGFSITEKIYNTIDFKGSPKWGLVGLKLRPFDSFEFEVDAFGNVIDIIQRQQSKEAKLDPDKFIHYVNQPEVDPVYGESDLRAVHDPWWRKVMYQKFESVYLERMGGGFVKASGGGTVTDPQKDALMDIINNISTRSGVFVPGEMDLELIFPKAGSNLFQEAIAAKNKEISKALLVPDQLGISDQGNTGSNAQASVQLEAFFMSLTTQADALADKMNEEVFKVLTWWNFGTKNAPVFKFNPLTDAARVKMAEAWTKAVQGQIVINTEEDEDRTRELLEYPPRNPDLQPEPEDTEDTGRPQPKKKPDLPPESEDRREFQAQGQPAFQRRADVRQIEAFFNAEKVSMTASMANATNAIFDDLMRQGEALAGVGPAEEIAVMTIPPELKRKLNAAVATGISNSFQMGQGEARAELRSAAELSDNQINLRQGIGRTKGEVRKRDKATGNFIEGLSPQTAEEFFQAKSFIITGDVSQDILDQVKFGLTESIKEGDSIDEIQAKLEETLKGLVGQKDAAGRVINVPARIETIARTNITEAFNEARLSTFTDPEIGGFVVAMEYSAVIDKNTTNFCKAMDGRIYRMESGMWSSPGGARRVPPAHFNCRSILIPVTEVDEFVESSPVPQSVEPAPGFGAATPTQES